MKRFLVAVANDFISGDYFVVNSRDNSIFFENWIHYNNRKFYNIIFKTITVNEEDLDSTIEYLHNIAKANNEIEIRELAKRAWFMFDFNFKHCTMEEKEQMILSYDLNE